MKRKCVTVAEMFSFNGMCFERKHLSVFRMLWREKVREGDCMFVLGEFYFWVCAIV
jgi:hypothetical protein